MVATQCATPTSMFAAAALLAASLGACGGGSSTDTIATTAMTVTTPGASDTLAFSKADFLAEQNAGSVSLSVNRAGSAAAAISVAYNTLDGTAVAGADYTAASGTLQWAENDAAAKSFSVALSNADPYSGTKAFTAELTSPSSGVALADPTASTVTVGGSGTTPTSTFWVYYKGVFAWGGDYSTAGTPNYKSTAGSPESGAYDIAFKVTGQYGIWAPYAGGSVPMWNFNASGYNYITLDLQPTVANQSWQFYFLQVGDIQIIGADGKQTFLNLANYGPAPVVGQWATYKVPLKLVLTQYASGTPVYETSIYKFGLQDQTGLSSNTWYIDNVGFTVN